VRTRDVCTHTFPRWCRNLTSRLLIAMRQQRAAPTAVWAEARGEGSLVLASIPVLQLPRCPAPPPSHEPLLLLCRHSGPGARLRGGWGAHLVKCHTLVAYRGCCGRRQTTPMNINLIYIHVVKFISIVVAEDVFLNLDFLLCFLGLLQRSFDNGRQGCQCKVSNSQVGACLKNIVILCFLFELINN